MSDSHVELRTLEIRIETLERFHKEEMGRKQRRFELSLKVLFWVPIAISVIIWTVVITLEIAEKR